MTSRDDTNLLQRIVGNLSPDNYTLTLTRPLISVDPFKPTHGKCYPYIWELQLVPLSIPFVSFVMPEGGTGFNPYSDLVIRISLSESPYYLFAEPNRTKPVDQYVFHVPQNLKIQTNPPSQ